MDNLKSICAGFILIFLSFSCLADNQSSGFYKPNKSYLYSVDKGVTWQKGTVVEINAHGVVFNNRYVLKGSFNLSEYRTLKLVQKFLASNNPSKFLIPAALHNIPIYYPTRRKTPSFMGEI